MVLLRFSIVLHVTGMLLIFITIHIKVNHYDVANIE